MFIGTPSPNQSRLRRSEIRARYTSRSCGAIKLKQRGIYKHFIPTGLMFVLVSLSAPIVPAQTNNLQTRLENAATLIRENRIAEAEQQLNSILRTAPDETAAINLLGAIRAQQGKLDEAETLLTRAAKIDPTFVPVHMNLAFLYVLKNFPDKTISELKEVVRLEPNNVEANYKLARLLLSRDQTDESIAVLEKVKSSMPQSVVFLTLLGDAFFKKGNLGKAEDNYLLALARQKDNPDAMMGLAKVSQSRGDTRTALAYLSRAKDVVGNGPEVLYRIGATALS